MTDRVYPSTKPTTNGTTATANPTFPANKAQLYNTTRSLYRPQPPSHRRSRSRSRRSCCRCCLWTTLFIFILLLLAAIAGAVIWVIYRPHRPSFSVTSLQVSQFNLTSTSQLTSRFNLTVSARNPNNKITFFYDPSSVSLTSNNINVGEGSIPGFVNGKKNTTTFRILITKTGGQELDSGEVSTLRSEMRNRNGVALKVELNTKVRVKIGSLKLRKVGVRISCDGIKAAVPTGRSPTTATTSGLKCKVDIRIKIWKWTI